VTIQVGQTASSVEVTAEGAPAIDLATTTIGADIGESLYKNVPVGRNISSVIAMAPGVSDGVGTGAANPSINVAYGPDNEYMINVLTKSGSNKYHGSFYGYFAPRQFEAERPDVNKVLTNVGTRIVAAGNYDFGGDLGGYLIKNKLFFYGGFNPQYGHSYRSAPPVFGNSSLGEIDVTTRTL